MEQPHGRTDEKLPDTFEALEPNFFSLGQGVDFYSRVAELPVELKVQFLTAMRDVVFDEAALLALRGVASMDLFVRPDSSTERREAVLQDWHRASLRSVITDLLAHWQPELGVQATYWGIKKMKTKWGSCNVSTRRIWLNLELAKKPVQCLEYIVVHELVHLLERNHTERFTALMDRHLADWRTRREVLNSSPLGHEAWGY